MKNKTIILADGRFPYGEVPLSYLKDAKTIICCDGAVDGLVDYGLQPDVVVGDMDSISDENKNKFASITHQSDDQETNDLTKAINYCVNAGILEVIILGATGFREDHALGNISLLASYADKLRVEMVTNHGIFSAIKSSSTLSSFKYQQVSIFCLDSHIRLKSKNLQYPIDDVIFDSWWKGSLNASLADEFTIEMVVPGKVIIFQTHLPKLPK